MSGAAAVPPTGMDTNPAGGQAAAAAGAGTTNTANSAAAAAAAAAASQSGGEKKEIYTYEAPWLIYGMNWSVRPDQKFRVALGSFVEDYNNKVEVRTYCHAAHMLDLTRYGVERNPGPVETIADMPSAGTQGRDWRPSLLGDWFEEQVELRLQAHAAVQHTKRVGGAGDKKAQVGSVSVLLTFLCARVCAASFHGLGRHRQGGAVERGVRAISVAGHLRAPVPHHQNHVLPGQTTRHPIGTHLPGMLHPKLTTCGWCVWCVCLVVVRTKWAAARICWRRRATICASGRCPQMAARSPSRCSRCSTTTKTQKSGDTTTYKSTHDA